MAKRKVWTAVVSIHGGELRAQGFSSRQELEAAMRNNVDPAWHNGFELRKMPRFNWPFARQPRYKFINKQK